MLIKYEFLKILRRKSTIITMVVSLIVTAFLFGLPIMQYQTYNQDGVIKGLDGISYRKEQIAAYSVLLTDEYIAQTVQDYQRLYEDPDNVGFDGIETYLIGDAYWNFVAPQESLLRVISSNYDDPGVSTGYNNKFPGLDMTNGANFYQTRNKKIEAIFTSLGMSDAQKDYWRGLNSGVDTPFQYGYYKGWSTIISCFELVMFAISAICIVIAPVFSGEYQAGTDAVILSAKYGKTKLVTAKIVAALLFGLLAFTLHMVIAFGLPLMAFGVDGWNLPLQSGNTVIPYPLTFMEATFINLGVIYLVLVAMIALTLLLSAKMKSPYLVLTVIIPVLFVPIFLTSNGTTGAYNLTLFLLPYKATVPRFADYITYQFGGLIMDAFTVRAVLYAVLTVIMLPLAKLGFKKHQVSA